MRIAVNIALTCVALAVTAVGVIGLGVEGICDTNCPSDDTVFAYKVAVCVGGIVSLVALAKCGGFLRGRWRDRSRREHHAKDDAAPPT